MWIVIVLAANEKDWKSRRKQANNYGPRCGHQMSQLRIYCTVHRHVYHCRTFPSLAVSMFILYCAFLLVDLMSCPFWLVGFVERGVDLHGADDDMFWQVATATQGANTREDLWQSCCHGKRPTNRCCRFSSCDHFRPIASVNFQYIYRVFCLCLQTLQALNYLKEEHGVIHRGTYLKIKWIVAAVVSII